MMNKGLIINEDIWLMVDDLEPEEMAELLASLSAYYQGKEIPEISRIVAMVFKRITADNARFDPENKTKVSAVRSEAGKKGMVSRWNAITNDNKNNKTEKAITKITNDNKNNKIAQEKDKEKDKEKNREREEEIEKKERCSTNTQRKNPLSAFPSLDTEEVREAWEHFALMRKSIKKPLTEAAGRLNAKKLEKLSRGDPIRAVLILDQSTMNSWQGLYDLESNRQAKKTRFEELMEV